MAFLCKQGPQVSEDALPETGTPGWHRKQGHHPDEPQELAQKLTQLQKQNSHIQGQEWRKVPQQREDSLQPGGHRVLTQSGWIFGSHVVVHDLKGFPRHRQLFWILNLLCIVCKVVRQGLKLSKHSGNNLNEKSGTVVECLPQHEETQQQRRPGNPRAIGAAAPGDQVTVRKLVPSFLGQEELPLQERQGNRD